jgi:hypothetical protein
MNLRGSKKLSTRALYDDYIKDFDESHPYYCTFKQFTDMTAEYYKYLSSQMIEASKVLKLPFRLGHIGVIKRKPKRIVSNSLIVDWQASRILGKWTPHINEHCGGFRYRFLWSKKQCMIVNKGLYGFRLSRWNKRWLAKTIKSGNTDYPEQIF